MTQEIATKQEAKTPVAVGERGLSLRNLDDMWRFAQMVVQGGFAPKGMEKPEAILVAVQMGLELGITPMQAIQGIAVINNRPTVWGDLAKALVDGSGLCEYCKEWFECEGENAVALCEVKRINRPNAVRGHFSVADAKRAGLWGKGSTWGFYPQRMLQMRARAFCLRDAFPDVLKGLSVREEVQDYVNVNATESAESGTSTEAPFEHAPIRQPQEKKPEAPQTPTQSAPAANGESLVGTVQAIRERKGTKKDPNQLYWFITIDSKDYATFDADIAALCQQDVTVRYTWKPGSKEGSRQLVSAEPVSEATEE